MDERDLHTDIWVNKATELSKMLGLYGKSAGQLKKWFCNPENRKKFYTEVKDGYHEVAYEMRIDERYIEYFASWVISNHDGDIPRYSIPVNLKFNILHGNLNKDIMIARDSMYKIFYKPYVPIPKKGDFWQLCKPPRAFYMAWPNHYLTGDYSQIRKSVKEVTGYWMTVLNIYNYGYEKNGKYYDGRLLYGPGLKKKSIKKALGVPEESKKDYKIAAIPFLQLGDHLQIYFPGNAPINCLNPSNQPRVERTHYITGKDKEYANICEKAIRYMASNEQLVNRGRKKKYSDLTTGTFKEFIKGVYNRLLDEKEKEDDNYDDEKIRNNVRKIRTEYINENGYFPDVEDTSIKNEWFDEVKKERKKGQD